MTIEWDWYRLQWWRFLCRRVFGHEPVTINDPLHPGWMVRCCGRCGREL